VDVQDVVGRGHHRPHLAGAAQLGAVVRALQQLGRPDAVEVVHQQPALERLALVERLVSRHVGEAHREGSDLRAHAGVEQVRGGRHAADLVAVRQGIDQHVRPGLAGLETVDVGDAGVALAVGRQVAWQDFEDGGIGGHGSIFTSPAVHL
jgi:hypothetical protein